MLDSGGDRGLVMEHISSGEICINFLLDILMLILLVDKHVCGHSSAICILIREKSGSEHPFWQRDYGTKK